MVTVDPFSAPKHLLPYIDAAEKSSQRARYVVALITIASVLAFASFWNSRESSWFQQRMRSTELALKYFDAQCESIPSPEQDSCRQAKDYAARRQISIKEHLVSQVQYMNQADVENVTLIRIPFFGVTFDVNDLGVLSGIAFSILLFWLMYALVSERHDVRFLFRTAIEIRAPDKPDLLLPIYRLLAMRQVLSVPPLIVRTGANSPPDHDNETNNRRLLNHAAKALFFMPVAVHAAILWNDFGTTELGDTISTEGTLTAIVTSAVLFAVIAVLTFFCVRISGLTDKEWAYASDQIHKGLPAKLMAMPSPVGAGQIKSDIS